MQNLQNHAVPNTLTFKENTIIWYRSLLLNQAHTDDMTGFNNGIPISYGMCPPVELMHYYQMDPTTQPPQKSGEMTCSKSCTQQLQIGTVTTTMTAHRPHNFSHFFLLRCLLFLLWHNKLNLVSNDFASIKIGNIAAKMEAICEINYLVYEKCLFTLKCNDVSALVERSSLF